jgi:hypothetical protein
MNLFRKMIGGKQHPGDGSDIDASASIEAEIRDMARSEDEAARADTNSGLVAIYPELGASRRKRRGFADVDLEDYVPELDDYEPGATGDYLGNGDPAAAARELAPIKDAIQPEFKPRSSTPPAPARLPPGMRRPPAGQRPVTAPKPTAAPADEDAHRPAPRPENTAPPTQRPPEPDHEPVRQTNGAAQRDGGFVEVPAPAAGRAGGGPRAGRVKTRLLGFDHAFSTADPFESASKAAPGRVDKFPVGWIIVVDGPGRGASFALLGGVSSVGRGEDQPIRLDFGDTSISRANHAMIAYDNEQRKFFLGHGGKANLVRLNGKPVLSTEEMHSDDTIRIGETTLKFIALCGKDFDWSQDKEDGASDDVTA